MIEGIKFHHFGIACRDIGKTSALYETIGYEKGETVFDPLQNINICFLTHQEMPLVELLAPVNDQSPVVKILEKNGTTPYHTCYSTPNLGETINRLKKEKFLIVSKPKTACAIGNRKVAFLYHSDMGLIELLED